MTRNFVVYTQPLSTVMRVKSRSLAGYVDKMHVGFCWKLPENRGYGSVT